MDQTRRNVFKAGGGASLYALLAVAGMLRPDAALAADWNQKAFEAKNLKDAFDALGAGSRTDSIGILMTAPEIAENGAVVPIGAVSKLPGTESIAILIAKNPTALAASFDIPLGTEPAVSTRVKMAETSEVHVLVKAQGKFYVTKKEIKVTIGGCGG
ncbi:MAG: thiosulfate oxidation carrier protein SoxY [Betaproteobacteria bacterium]|nr:MAG: thiosulfate oxidation carrier protein SoxY [Betaproteobacteria bacterium]